MASRALGQDLPVGLKLGHYRIADKIGVGGMGEVYRARDEHLARDVAIKVLPPGTLTDASARKHFHTEALILSQLNHPNIATIYDFDAQQEVDFLVMEYIPGITLSEKLAGGLLPEKDVLRLGVQLADGMAAAHDHGIVHRDLKPGNLRVTSDERLKILDFGLAKLRLPVTASATTESLSETQAMAGTLPYMAPEQLLGGAIDARTDLHAAGLVLYEMATGRYPFAEVERSQLIGAILSRPPRSPAALNPKLSPELQRIIGKCLEKEPENRYQSAKELAVDLRRLGMPSIATENSVSRQAPKYRSWKFLLAYGITAAVLFGFGMQLIRPRRVHALTERDTVVLADFANSTGDPVFDDTLKAGLNVSLRQSPFLSLLSDSQVTATLHLMTLPASTKLTVEVARELCQRAGSKAYIAGSIGSLGSEYVLGLKAVNCQNGDTLAQEQVTAASKERVLDTLGKTASALRGELGESLAMVQQFDTPLEQATTPSLEALKALSLGNKAAIREEGIAAALPYYQRAVQLDPSFATGYMHVGEVYFDLGEVGRASEYFTRAFQLRDHASELEKLNISTYYYRVVTGELDKAAKTVQEEIANYPRNSFGYGNLGLVLAFMGQYPKAAEMTREALRRTPEGGAWPGNLANDELALQHFAEVRRIIHEAQARKLDGPLHHNALYAGAFLAPNATAMAEEQQWFASHPEYEDYGLALASDNEAYAGHIGKARELTKRAVKSALRVDRAEMGAIYSAIAAQREAAYGNLANARQLAKDAFKLAPSRPGAEAETALAFAMAGERTRADSLAQDLGKRFPLDTQMQSLWLPAIQAQLALERKNPGSALSTLQAASPIELGQIQFVLNISCLYPVHVRGEAYLAAGQGHAAATEFQKILDHSGLVWNCWTGALAHLGVARANALQARTSQGADADAARVRALTAYRDFLTLWKDADPDTPVLKQAKAEYSRLQ